MPLVGRSVSRALLQRGWLLGSRLAQAREQPAGFGLELAYQREVTFGPTVSPMSPQ
jgi:hypothetical protein